MAKHLSDRDVEQIVEILDGWRGDLTWAALCEACKPRIGVAPARQTLYRFSRIKHAYQTAKDRIRNAGSEVKSLPSMRVATERIARLENENARLKDENRRLLEQFVVWQYNAHVRGMSDHDLNRALPSIDRGNTVPLRAVQTRGK